MTGQLPVQPPVVPITELKSRRGQKVKATSVRRGGPPALWPSYLYRGVYTQLFGDSGMGKTLIGCDLVARCSRGLPFPETEEPIAPMDCLILTSEDTPGTFVERLELAGADLSRIEFVSNRPPLTELDSMLAGIGLLFIETLDVHLPAVNMNDNSQVRQALDPMLVTLDKHQTVGLCVRHANKNPKLAGIHRAAGAAAFVAASRVTLLTGKGPNDARYLTVEKINLAIGRPPLKYEITGDPKIAWEGYDREAEPSLAPQLAAAVEFLRKELAGGPKKSKAIKAAANDRAIIYPLLHEAKVYLGVEHVWDGFQKGTTWRLPIPSGGPAEVDLRTLGEEPLEHD